MSYCPDTKKNYEKIYHLTQKENISLIAMQYPMRDVSQLKKMLTSFKDIIFVDNEINFKNAVTQNGYDKYFTDMFAGDFGHATAEGNRLLAENVAQTILKEVFRK